MRVSELFSMFWVSNYRLHPNTLIKASHREAFSVQRDNHPYDSRESKKVYMS